jgi:hypothetical protein
MFDPEHTSDEVELSDEDCRATLTESEAIGTSFAIPACFDSIRYYEIVVETNRGGIFVGAPAPGALFFRSTFFIWLRVFVYLLFCGLAGIFSPRQGRQKREKISEMKICDD